MVSAELEPWKKLDWNEETQRIIYREWGVYYNSKQKCHVGTQYYNKSLDIKGDDVKALTCRSLCQRVNAKTEGALKDGMYAMEIDSLSQPANLAVCDALYDLNQFENSRTQLHQSKRKFDGSKIVPFSERLQVLDEHFKDTMGKSMGPFLLKNRNHFGDVVEDLKRRSSFDPRPLWKILKEQEKCDVVSVIEKEEELLHPREVARRQRAFKVYNQIYFNKSWTDVLFLKGMRDNPTLLLRQAGSTSEMEKFARSKYKTVLKFMKMLQSRNPLYNEKPRRCPNKALAKQARESHLYRVQYQTRRFMLIVLNRVAELRKKGDVKELAKYIEEVMGDYTVLKTHRVMPWMFEFMNDVYNSLGLAYTDSLKVPDNLSLIKPRDRLYSLMQIPRAAEKEKHVGFVFGNRDTYEEPDAVDFNYVHYKKTVTRLERRLLFAKFPIEKCYLLHEIAKLHFSNGKFDESVSVARRALTEAASCNNLLWNFLSQLLICKCHVSQSKIEKLSECLQKLKPVAAQLRNRRIMHFVNICKGINAEELEAKRRRHSIESQFLRRSGKASMATIASDRSFMSTM